MTEALPRTLADGWQKGAGGSMRQGKPPAEAARQVVGDRAGVTFFNILIGVLFIMTLKRVVGHHADHR
jgi:hypothetical protein